MISPQGEGNSREGCCRGEPACSPGCSPAGRGEFDGRSERYALARCHVGAGFKPAQADGKCYFQGSKVKTIPLLWRGARQGGVVVFFEGCPSGRGGRILRGVPVRAGWSYSSRGARQGGVVHAPSGQGRSCPVLDHPGATHHPSKGGELGGYFMSRPPCRLRHHQKDENAP
jgi:hypothetical protein